LLLYSSKPSLGVYQLAGHFTSSTNANKLSSTIITAPSISFLAPLLGRSGRLLRGEFSHAHPLLCFIVLLYFIYFTGVVLYQKPKKIRILGSCFYLFTLVLLKWPILKTPSCATLLAQTIVILSALLLHHLLLLQTFMRLSLLC
jgi:hypothetical protein